MVALTEVVKASFLLINVIVGRIWFGKESSIDQVVP